MKNRSKTNRTKTNRSKKKIKTNKNKSKTSKIYTQKNRSYEMQPIYGGNNVKTILKNSVKSTASGLGSILTGNLRDGVINTVKGVGTGAYGITKGITKGTYNVGKHMVYSPLKYVGQKTLGIATAPVRGLARNTGRAVGNLIGNTSGGPNSPMDITYSIGSMGKSVLSGITNMGKERLTSKEKVNVMKALEYLKQYNKISEDAYQHAITQINKKDGVLGIADSVVSIMAPIQGIVKVIGDWLVPVNANDLHGRSTLVKVLQFPKASKNFVKNSLGKNGKDIELDENMVLIKDYFPSTSEKFAYELNSADNYLANAINGCIGPGCSNGVTHITPSLSHEINITNNASMKKLLKEIREKEKSDQV